MLNAWSRMKGISPIEAQKLYVESLIHLLTELVHRYPHHEQSSFLKKALYSLEHDEEEDEELYQDAYDPIEFESQHNFLNHIEPDQLRRQDIYSPPTTPAQPQQSHYRQQSISDISHTEYPITPITSPGRHQNSVTSQWVLNQLQQKPTNYAVHPMDFLQGQQQQQQEEEQQQQQVDTLSETDSMDREVAATTANLALSSPRQSPYTQPKKSFSSSVGSSTTSSQQQRQKKKKRKDSTRALERLQTEVTALTEQMDRLRRNSLVEANNRKDRKGWALKNLCLLLIKHLMVNSAILFIAFYILYKRKSPVAYAVMNYITPWMQQIIRNIIRRIVFWKVTV
ncbi:hypothetical protein BD770DRAFT_7714 [Pilaira anomala]|nr:hypothetical protein BD770DRAFT_7714 [Pilaira anomala]